MSDEELHNRISLKLAELRKLVLEGISKSDKLTHEQMEVIDLQGQRYVQLYQNYITLRKREE